MAEIKKVSLFIKRIVDIAAGFSGGLILSPLFLLAGLSIKITMPGPVLFKQSRVGKDGREFWIFKFRTMKNDREAEQAHDFSRDEERLTKTGRFLRRTKIDELPQLFNVLRGDMSLVGPRPTVAEQVANYSERQKKRLRMRPGMTGLAQVNGNTALTWEERIEYDLEYIEHFSLLLDWKILMKTVAVVFLGEEEFRQKRKAGD